MCWLLFCLTGSPKKKEKKKHSTQRERERVVCVLDRERKRVLASRALAVVSVGGNVSDWLHGLFFFL